MACYTALHDVTQYYTALHDVTHLLDGSSAVYRKVKGGGEKLLRLTTELLAILTERERERESKGQRKEGAGLNSEVWRCREPRFSAPNFVSEPLKTESLGLRLWRGRKRAGSLASS